MYYGYSNTRRSEQTGSKMGDRDREWGVGVGVENGKNNRRIGRAPREKIDTSEYTESIE